MVANLVKDKDELRLFMVVIQWDGAAIQVNNVRKLHGSEEWNAEAKRHD